MPPARFLEVTREPETLCLEPGASGQITYTVTNRTDSADEVRLILPESKGLELGVLGTRQQDLSVEGTATYKVLVSASAGAEPNVQDLCVCFVAAKSPDVEHPASATRVRIAQPSAVVGVEPVTGRKLPWRLIAAIAGALVAVVGIAVWISQGPKTRTLALHGKESNGSCVSLKDCRGGQICKREDGATPSAGSPGRCLQLEAQPCTVNGDCATGYCKPPAAGAANASGSCQRRLSPGGACDTDPDCAAPATCSAHKCGLPLATRCAGDAECATGVCGLAPSQKNKVCETARVVDHSCADIKLRLSETRDGVYWIDPDDTGKAFAPFQVWCANMNRGAPVEFLELSKVSGPDERRSNYAVFAGGGYCPCGDQIIRYTKVRIDPKLLTLFSEDVTFAVVTSEGECGPCDPSLPPSGNCRKENCQGTFYGLAASCKAEGPPGAVGRANIDLRGTPFHVDESQAFAATGWYATGSVLPGASRDQSRKVFDFAGGGACGSFGAQGNRVKLAQDL